MTPTRLLLLAMLAPSLRPSSRRNKEPSSRSPAPRRGCGIDTVGTWVVVPGSTNEGLSRRTLEAYKALKIKIDMVDSVTGQIGSPGFQQTGSLAGNRMSAWIRCGEGITGPNADTWRVSMAVLSGVERVTKDTTRVRTVVVASARNMTGGASPPMMCTTSGRLEEKINLQVQAQAAARSRTLARGYHEDAPDSLAGRHRVAVSRRRLGQPPNFPNGRSRSGV